MEEPLPWRFVCPPWSDEVLPPPGKTRKATCRLPAGASAVFGAAAGFVLLRLRRPSGQANILDARHFVGARPRAEREASKSLRVSRNAPDGLWGGKADANGCYAHTTRLGTPDPAVLQLCAGCVSRVTLRVRCMTCVYTSGRQLRRLRLAAAAGAADLASLAARPAHVPASGRAPPASPATWRPSLPPPAAMAAQVDCHLHGRLHRLGLPAWPRSLPAVPEALASQVAAAVAAAPTAAAR